jgi:hypothetical protein
MPEAAASNEKVDLVRASLLHLSERGQQLSVNHPRPVVLIGKVTYKMCAAALRERGFLVLNSTAIDHPRHRAGEVKFKQLLRSARARSAEALHQAIADLLPKSLPIMLKPGSGLRM